jgi:uncharacterized membrane protein YecN with MAPEG domain
MKGTVMAFQVTSLYAAIRALAAVTLSVLVSLRPARHGVSIPDTGHINRSLAIQRPHA